MGSEPQEPPGGDIDSRLRRPSPHQLPPMGAHKRPLSSASSPVPTPPVFQKRTLLVTAACVAAGCAVGGLLRGVSFDTDTSANREKGLPEGSHDGGDHQHSSFIPVPRLPEQFLWESSELLSTSSREGLPSSADEGGRTLLADDESRLPSAGGGGDSTVGALPTGDAAHGIGTDRRPARAGTEIDNQPRQGARGGSKAQHVLVELEMLLSSDDNGVAAHPGRGVEGGVGDLPRPAAGKDADAVAGMSVGIEEARGDRSDYRYHDLYHRAAAAEEGGGVVPTIVFESDVASRGGSTPHSVTRDTTSGLVGDDNSAANDEDGMCSPLEVVGLDACPDLAGTVEKMLAAKADMLRQVIEVLTDPASAGIGGKRDEPLLLVKKLAVDETDAIFGAFEPVFNGHTTDSTGWSPLPGGFNRWVERYHRDVLKKTRPVLVTVHGDDVCALERELSREARAPSAGAEQVFSDNNTRQSGRRMPGEGEDFEVPVVLMTLGWDPAGDPTHREDVLGRDHTCVFRVLEMPRVKRWFSSHTRYDSHTDELFRYLPIGFGGHETRNGLPHTSYIAAAQRQLEILETCPTGKSGRKGRACASESPAWARL